MSLSTINIPTDWQIRKFDEIAFLRHGYQFRQHDFTDEGIKIFKITQINSDGSIDVSNCSVIDANRLDQFERVILNRGDILMALTGATLGKIARFRSDETVLQNYRVGNFLPLDSDQLNKDYFYYYLSSKFFLNQVFSMQTQSAQQNIGKEDINNMSVILPPLPEQKAIAAILSALDDKIELNLQMNKTLEEMAMTLYKHWFVDFGPFQNGKFVESELGMIPEGWEVKKIDKLIELNPKLKLTKGQEASFVEMKALPTDAMSVSDVDIKEFKGGSKFQNGDTLFARITPCLENGKTAYVDFLEEKEIAFGSTEFLVMRALEGVSKFWVYCLSREPNFRSFAISTMVGTSGRQRVQNDPFLNYEVAAPSSAVFSEFSDITQSWFEKIRVNTLVNITLTKTRDTLLPKLISGEVRVKQAEQIVKDAL